MKKTSKSQPELTIGMDLGDRHSRLCVLDAEGEVIEESRVPTTPKALQKRFGSMPRWRIALEVGTHSPWVSRLLKKCGHEVFVANPWQVRLIGKSSCKDDRLDAERLARLARLDPKLLYPIQHRGEDSQRLRAHLRSRDALVRSRALLINHVRGLVKSFGGRLKSCSAASFHRHAAIGVNAALRPGVDLVLKQLEEMTQSIRAYDRQLERVSGEECPETALLRQVPGVGPLTALTYVLTLEDPSRFPTSRTVGAYLGLTRRRRQSGESDPQLRISKRGDPYLRRLLVNCAQYILGPFGPDSDLRRRGLALAARGGKCAKKKAVIAVARKLAVLLHRLWVSGEIYQPLRANGGKT